MGDDDKSTLSEIAGGLVGIGMAVTGMFGDSVEDKYAQLKDLENQNEKELAVDDDD